MNLRGKVAIVTGAGRGIGRMEALALANAGAQVVVNDIGALPDGTGDDSRPADAVVTDIAAAGGEAVADYSDVTTSANVEQLVQHALDAFGRLDILVNNAGIVRSGPIVDATEADWDALMAIHLKAPFLLSRCAAKVLLKQRSGRIINTSSEAGFGLAGVGVYGAAKEGVTALTRTLAVELADDGVTVNVIRPRAFTRMSPLSPPSVMPIDDPEVFTPGNVAALVTYLSSDAASDITGCDFIVGGGKLGVIARQRPKRWIGWTQDADADDIELLRQVIAE